MCRRNTKIDYAEIIHPSLIRKGKCARPRNIHDRSRALALRIDRVMLYHNMIKEQRQMGKTITADMVRRYLWELRHLIEESREIYAWRN